MADRIVQGIVEKMYGPSEPELDPEMVTVAMGLAHGALRKTWDVEQWTEQFATGDEAVDRPRYREYRRVILNTLADLVQDELRRMEEPGMTQQAEAAPKPGDRFVHAHYLRVTARPPYGDDSYEIREVTAVRKGRVYHRPACITGPADRWFAVTDTAGHVREWLTGRLVTPHNCLEPFTGACPHLSHRFE